MASNKPPSPERLAEWSALLDEGYSYKHVAELTKASNTTIAKYLPGRGWSHKQVTQHGTLVRTMNAKLRKVTYAVV